MKDFILYLIFSGLEYLSILLLLFSIFSFQARYYIKEILISSFVILTPLTYIVVYFELYDQISAPLVIATVLSILLRKYFKINVWLAIVSSVVSVATFGLISALIVYIAINTDFIKISNLSMTNNWRTYVIQFTTFIVSMLVSFNISKFNSGFGVLLDKLSSRLLLISLLITLTIITIIPFIIYYPIQTITCLLGIIGLLLISIVILLFSIKLKERTEYQEELERR